MPYGETAVTVDEGDCVVLFSDGVADAQSEAGEEFGDERLIEIVRAAMDQPSHAIVTRVFDAIDRFVDGAPQFDDITILVLRHHPAHA